MVGFPRQLVCLTAGVVYGFGWVFFYATIATVIGALLAYNWARWLGHEWGKISFPCKTKKNSSFYSNKPFSYRSYLPFDACGFFRSVEYHGWYSWYFRYAFYLCDFSGKLSTNGCFVLLGGGIRIGHFGQITLSLLLLAVSILAGLILMKRSFNKKR